MEVAPVDDPLQGVPVPAGDHVIELVYRDPWIGRGVAGSLLTRSACSWSPLSPLLGLPGGRSGRNTRKGSPASRSILDPGAPATELAEPGATSVKPTPVPIEGFSDPCLKSSKIACLESSSIPGPSSSTAGRAPSGSRSTRARCGTLPGCAGSR